MNSKIYNLLEQLETRDLPRDDSGIITYDGKKIKQIGEYDPKALTINGVNKYTFDEIPVISKTPQIYSPYMNTNICTEILCGNAYNELGINSVVAYPFNAKRSIFDELLGLPERLSVVTQDLNSVGGIYVCAPRNVDAFNWYRNIHWLRDETSDNDESMWSFLKDRENLVKYRRVMTDDCFNQLINLFLIDTVFTQFDRHIDNYMFYKTDKNNPRWEGVIAIDNEWSLVNSFMSRKQSISQTWYDIITADKNFYTPKSKLNRSTQQKRLDEINELLHNGTFGESQVELVNRLKNYDIYSKLDSFEQDNHIKMDKKQKDLYKYLFEYTQKTLGD